MALKENLTAYRERVEAGIDACIPSAETRPRQLHAAMRYSMEAGGKRIRPVLLLAASELFPGIADPLPAAVAIECLHTYTLIHDDLPAVDNSPLRRGRPSCHAQFDEATAILAGDGLLTLAFELLSRHYGEQPDLAVVLIGDLASAAGSTQLIGGQMEDILNEGKAIEADTLAYIHRNKTAALLTAALTMGLRFGAPDAERLAHGRALGHHLGMAFQIIDDILDATADAKTLGKPVGNDAGAGKSTYPALLGLDGARAAAAEHTAKALEAVELIGGDTTFLSDLVRELGSRIR